MYCEICKKEVGVLGRHLCRTHKELNPKDYYDKFLRQPDEGICEYCGKETTFYNIGRGYSKCCCRSCGASVGQKKRFQDPEERRKNAERVKKQMSDPKVKKHLSEIQTKRMADPEIRRQLSESVKKTDFIQNTIHTKEYSDMMHDILIKRYSIKENRDKMSESCKNSEIFQQSRKSKEFREKCSYNMSERIRKQNYNTKVLYKYDNIIFMSFPELAFYAYNKTLNKEVEYQIDPIVYEEQGIEKKYVPDFRIDGVIYEIKGPHLIKDGHLWDPWKKNFY